MSKKAKNEFGLLIEMFDKSTQDVINEFLTYYKVSSHGQYINAIYNMLFEAVGKSNLADLTYIDYGKVLKFYNTDGQNERSQDKYRSVFFKYLYAFDIIKNNEGFENIWLKKDCINHFDKIKNRKSKKKYIPVLTFEELEKFREYINMDCEENKEKMKISFLGYMLYYTNCSVSELIKMSAVNYKDGKVISNENKEYEIPNKYKNLFTKNLSDKGYNGFYTINDIISKLGNILEIKNLTPQTIKSAKKQNSICCSLCGEYYLNNLNNWVSVNNKLVCVECSKELKKTSIVI